MDSDASEAPADEASSDALAVLAALAVELFELVDLEVDASAACVLLLSDEGVSLASELVELAAFDDVAAEDFDSEEVADELVEEEAASFDELVLEVVAVEEAEAEPVEAVSTVVVLEADDFFVDSVELEALLAVDSACELLVRASLEETLAAWESLESVDELFAFDETALPVEATEEEASLLAVFEEVAGLVAVVADGVVVACCEELELIGTADVAGGMTASDTRAPQNKAVHVTSVTGESGRREERRAEGVSERSASVLVFAVRRLSHQRRSAPERMGVSTKRKERSETAKMMTICAMRTHQGTSIVEVMRDVARMMG